MTDLLSLRSDHWITVAPIVATRAAARKGGRLCRAAASFNKRLQRTACRHLLGLPSRSERGTQPLNRRAVGRTEVSSSKLPIWRESLSISSSTCLWPSDSNLLRRCGIALLRTRRTSRLPKINARNWTVDSKLTSKPQLQARLGSRSRVLGAANEPWSTRSCRSRAGYS